MTEARALSREEIVAALERCGGNVRAAARLLGVSHSPFRRRVQRDGLEAHTVRVPGRARGAAYVKGAAAARVRRPPGHPRAVVLHVPEDDGVRVVRNVAIDHEVRSVNAQREHWGQRANRRAKVHRVIGEAFGLPAWTPPVLPAGWKWLAIFMRYGPLTIDADNFVALWKEHIDTVAEDVLRLKSDADPRFEFRVVQVKRRERAMVQRWDKQAHRSVMKPGFKSWFRIRLEMVRVDAAPIRWALVERCELGTPIPSSPLVSVDA